MPDSQTAEVLSDPSFGAVDTLDQTHRSTPTDEQADESLVDCVLWTQAMMDAPRDGYARQSERTR